MQSSGKHTPHPQHHSPAGIATGLSVASVTTRSQRARSSRTIARRCCRFHASDNATQTCGSLAFFCDLLDALEQQLKLRCANCGGRFTALEALILCNPDIHSGNAKSKHVQCLRERVANVACQYVNESHNPPPCCSPATASARSVSSLPSNPSLKCQLPTCVV